MASRRLNPVLSKACCACALAIAVAFLPAAWGRTLHLDQRDTVLAFTATWCAPCQKDKKLYPKLARRYTVKVYDVDKYPDTASKYRVRQLPTYVVLRGGREITRTTNIHELLR